MAIGKSIEGSGRLVGYARVSTSEQDTALQLAAFKGAGVEVVFEEKRSGANLDRPELAAALRSLRPGDTLCVFKVDRLARSLIDLMHTLREIEVKRCGFRSLTEPIETVTPAGRLMVQILGAFAEFERNVIRERCEAGRQAARQRGVYGGRPRKVDYERLAELRARGLTFVEIAAEMGIPRSSAINAFRRVATFGAAYAGGDLAARGGAA